MKTDEVPHRGQAVAKKPDEPRSVATMLIDRKKLLSMIPLAERTIFDMEQRGEFPHRILLTARRVAWDLNKVEEWIEERRAAGAQAARPGFTHLVEQGRR